MVKKWKLFFSKRAVSDSKTLQLSNLKRKAEEILNLIEQDHLANHPPFKKLIGDFDWYYSRRININYRVVYSIDNKNHEVRVLSMRTYYHD